MYKVIRFLPIKNFVHNKKYNRFNLQYVYTITRYFVLATSSRIRVVFNSPCLMKLYSLWRKVCIFIKEEQVRLVRCNGQFFISAQCLFCISYTFCDSFKFAFIDFCHVDRISIIYKVH